MEQKLSSKNFILLILGQISSLFGNLTLKLALSMYVLEVTGSASIFAGILAIATIPTILLSPFGGILADRLNRRNIMVTLDLLSGISVLCAAIFFQERNGILVIGVLLVVLSILGAFETPTVQACIPQMLAGDNILKGNAVVNQIAAITSLIAPFLGSVFYAAFGLKPVILACIICFFLTALFERFIRLEPIVQDNSEEIFAIIRQDFTKSMHFLCREEPGILHMLLTVALVRFFVMGTVLVGLPFIIRSILLLNAKYYGIAESALGIATILGSIAAGLLTGKWKAYRLNLMIAVLGFCFLPAGIAFLLPFPTTARYLLTIAAFCGIQAAASIFSIYAVSSIQQKTPNCLIGKVMAYTSAITMCVQPLGQALYGLMFDRLRNTIHMILIPTGLIVCMISLGASDLFHRRK